MPDSVPRPRRFISPARAEATVPPPFEGVWAPSDLGLDAVEVLPLPDGTGPEDVVVDGSGRVVSGADDGRIWRWTDGVPAVLAETGGRPLGIEFDPRDGTLIVCDAYRGLLRVDGDGAITELATHAAGVKIGVCNNAGVARDGTVYFSDSSTRYPLSGWKH